MREEFCSSIELFKIEEATETVINCATGKMETVNTKVDILEIIEKEIIQNRRLSHFKSASIESLTDMNRR